MLDKCGEGTRYVYQNPFECALVPKAVSNSVAYARRDGVMNVNLFLVARLDLSCDRPLCTSAVVRNESAHFHNIIIYETYSNLVVLLNY